MKSSNATPPNTGNIGGVGPVSAAKAYRLLKAIMNTAVEDKMIKSNPCQIKSGGK